MNTKPVTVVTENPAELARVPWALQMDELGKALADRGKDVAGGRLQLISVPPEERTNGRPLFRVVLS